jgi:hypothetical protein
MLLDLNATALVLDHAFKPFDTAIMRGGAVREYLLECQQQLERFQALADDFIAERPAALTVRELAARLAEDEGLPGANVYACMLAVAFLQAAEDVGPINLQVPIPDLQYRQR